MYRIPSRAPSETARPGRRVPRLPAALMALAVVGAIPTTTADAAGAPTLRLFPTSDTVEVQRSRDGQVSLARAGVWVSAVGGGFELHVSRPRWRDPIQVDQVDAETGAVLRPLPPEILAGWAGLKDFLRVRILDRDGAVVYRRVVPFCPNSWRIQRAGDGGPPESPYPNWCSGQPLTKGMVWGIAEDWAVNPLGGRGAGRPQLSNGRYTVMVWISATYASLFEIPPADARTSFTLKVRSGRSGPGGGAEPATVRRGPTAGVPDTTNPPRRTLPDLRALPSWGISVRGDQLSFAATEWNAGKAPLVVEGFRRRDADTMDAYQYFYDGDTPVGRTAVGEMEFDSRPGHRHWHFLQFVRYQLVDEERRVVVRSGKQAFCLVPTDAVDLTVRNANWRPETIGLNSACGSADSIWIREVLDVGWGDTYFQFVPGQSFNVARVPNGTYFIRIEVNPRRDLLERNYDNNVSLRRIRLQGKPGARRVVVPPWRGIDTEGDCWDCGVIGIGAHA